MANEIEKIIKSLGKPMRITVSRNGPYIVTGGIPLIGSKTFDDEEGNCIDWLEIKYPLKERYALCHCGHSQNKPFCDGTHTNIHFYGTEAGDYKPYSESVKVISGHVQL